jgi:hypothetical protein
MCHSNLLTRAACSSLSPQCRLGDPWYALAKHLAPFDAVLFRRQRKMGSLPQAVQDAADISAVSHLVLRERLSRDLGLWEQMRDCFHDDSVVRISWINASGPEFVRRSKEMAERNVKASHRRLTSTD